MVHKTILVLVAILCTCKCRPQDNLTAEEKEILNTWNEALSSFYKEMMSSLEYVIKELNDIIDILTKDEEDGFGLLPNVTLKMDPADLRDDRLSLTWQFPKPLFSSLPIKVDADIKALP